MYIHNLSLNSLKYSFLLLPQSAQLYEAHIVITELSGPVLKIWGSYGSKEGQLKNANMQHKTKK